MADLFDLISPTLAVLVFALYAWNSASRDSVIFQLIDLQRESAIRIDPAIVSLQKRFHKTAALERVSLAALVSFLVFGLSLSAVSFSVLLLALFRLVFEPRLNSLRDRSPWSVGETAASDKAIRRLANWIPLASITYEEVSAALSVSAVIIAALVFMFTLYF